MPRTRSLAWAQLKVGLLTIAGLTLAAVFVFMVGGQAGFFWQKYHVKTRFADVQGLKPGAVVRVAGVEVGTVDSMEFAGSEVEVVMSVSKRMRDRITSDSRASIGSISLLGSPVVDISPSSTGRPVDDWGLVPSRRPFGQLADVAENATKALQQATALLQDLRAGRGVMGKLFTDDTLYRELTSFVSAADDVVAALNAAEGTMGRLIKDPELYRTLKTSLDHLADVTARVSAGEGSLGRLLKDDAFGRSLTAATGNVEQITGRITKGEGTLGKLATDESLFNRITAVSERLDVLVRRLNEGEGTAGRLLQDRQLYENMNGAVSELRALIGEIRKDPKKYLNVKVSLF